MRVVDSSGVALPGDVAALDDGARALGLELDATCITRLLSYAQLLERWNKAFNLVSRKDVDRLIARHLLDSLSVLPWLQGPLVMDLGTGAGLPGIPLAIARCDLSFTLVDRSERKIRFLTQVVGELGLANVVVCCQNMKASLKTEQNKFSTVTARAVATPTDVWQIVRDRLGVGGRLILLDRVTPDLVENLANETDGPSSSVVGEEFPGAVVERVHIRIPGLCEAHGVLIVERC